MICGLFATLAQSAWTRTAIRYGITATAMLLFLLALRRAGRLAEQLETIEMAHDVQRRMLEAAARRPASHNDLAERMRDGRF